MSGDHVVLVGMMGSGKTSVGAALARRLGRPFVDADARLEAAVGCTISQLFADRGEAAFRALERDQLRELLGGRGALVVATGGGVVLDQANRALLEQATTVWLDVGPEALAGRLGTDPSRPLLGDDPAGRLAALHEQRRPFYEAVARLVVDGASGLVEQVAERIAIALRPPHEVGPLTSVVVELGERSYPVVVGPGASGELAGLLPGGTRRVAVVTQASVPVAVDPDVEHRVFLVGEGEEAKSLDTVEGLCRAFAAWGMSRADAVVAVGGGVVTDVAGFAAAVYHRGIPVVHVSTTLLGQVDAAIGGKTGVNLPEGKNLLGAFWQPSAVLCDTDHLATLPPREYRSGMGELAKYHFLGGGDLDELALPERVARAVAVKADVVAGDEREGGRRATLNYGHTLAHALEVAGAFDLRHGEAVAVGLVYAAELARALGRIDEARVAEHRRVVAAYGLPSRLPRGAAPDELVALMGRDKKALRGLTFVLEGPRGVEVCSGIERAPVEAAFTALGWEP
ncbi:MAG: iron-containing alcohol dehydrogenase [Acidimicrobiia bacterium]|nr:iron-containing alcohol dehydrogenase [Acidimicrobiia bacterium]